MKDCKHLIASGLLVFGGMTAACASKGNVRPQPFPVPGGSPAAPVASPPVASQPAPTPAPPQQTATLVDAALRFRGTPYRNGGSDPSGFDCSGFTQWVFAQYGFVLPREVQEQFKVGEKIKLDDLKPGDLVFFHTVARGASHVGIFVDGDQFVHAPSSKGVVRTESINSSYWAPRFLGARRIEGAAEAPAAVKRRPSAEESAVAAALESTASR